MPAADGGVRITQRQVYEKLLEVAEDVTILKARDCCNDHEARVRKLERWAWGIPITGVLGVLGIAVRMAH